MLPVEVNGSAQVWCGPEMQDFSCYRRGEAKLLPLVMKPLRLRDRHPELRALHRRFDLTNVCRVL